MRRPILRPKYSSNSGIFEKRGDPWMTQREGTKDFQRNPETEDAERDFDHRYDDTAFGPKQAEPRKEYRDPKPAPDTDDFQRRKASIARRMHSRMNARAPRIEVPAPERHFKTCPGCKLAKCAAHGRCFGEV